MLVKHGKRFSAVIAFSGIIDSALEQVITVNGLKFHTIKCTDWHYLADKRIIAKAYKGVTAGAIVKDIVSNYLIPEGIKDIYITWDEYAGKKWGDF